MAVQLVIKLVDMTKTWSLVLFLVLDCVPQPYGQVPSAYHLASMEEVQEHKQWILKSMEKWAIAKFADGYVSI